MDRQREGGIKKLRHLLKGVFLSWVQASVQEHKHHFRIP